MESNVGAELIGWFFLFLAVVGWIVIVEVVGWAVTGRSFIGWFERWLP